ncbi:MAG: PEP/pyruvate-binding domain-containing protein, partial [Firmicutes bacterium]|nr:PEP/pyruvate-binding domain-containing protein [Bacillota bacterium]
NQLETAIKLVYASIFTESALSYFDAVNYKIEEEKMAVIIQEVVGHQYNGRYYPSISGVAQSFNYYPVAYMEPEDGFAVAAVGLGMYVVGGENSYRFCPKYPNINPTNVKDQVRDSQKDFYAMDMQHDEIDLVNGGENAAIVKYKIKDAGDDGVLQHCASVYDRENDDLVPGVDIDGPLVIDFANILKYNYIPLSETINFLLRLFREAMGSPVEMEFAVDMENGEYELPTFYLLQIKPLIRREEQVQVELGNIHDENVFLYAKRGMGNGLIDTVKDVVYVDPEKFDKLKTREIAREINEINKKFDTEGREYILVGPGRWGTRDQFTGIPVTWAKISCARVIVEMGLPDFPLDGSLGSHFFHNVTSMNVGYFSVPHNSRDARIDMKVLKEQELIEAKNFVKHVRFKENLSVLMDGRKREALIRY